MTRYTASQIAEVITNQQLAEMLEAAKSGIQDWTATSAVNKGMTIGTTWNVLASGFDVSQKLHILAKTNMVWEFGGFLPDSIKKPFEPKPIIPTHQEPIF